MIQAEAMQRGWYVVDMCKILSQLAFRRQRGNVAYDFPSEFVAALKANPTTKDRVTEDGQVLLDTRYVRIDLQTGHPKKQYTGGLFSLDGIHPSTIGYGLAAHEFLKVMQKAWAADGEHRDLKPLNWNAIVASDSLAMNPPANLANLQDTLGFLYSQTPLGQLINMIGGLGE